MKDFRHNISEHRGVTEIAPDLFYIDGDPDTFTDTPGAKFDNRLMILNLMVRFSTAVQKKTQKKPTSL